MDLGVLMPYLVARRYSSVMLIFERHLLEYIRDARHTNLPVFEAQNMIPETR